MEHREFAGKRTTSTSTSAAGAGSPARSPVFGGRTVVRDLLEAGAEACAAGVDRIGGAGRQQPGLGARRCASAAAEQKPHRERLSAPAGPQGRLAGLGRAVRRRAAGAVAAAAENVLRLGRGPRGDEPSRGRPIKWKTTRFHTGEDDEPRAPQGVGRAAPAGCTAGRRAPGEEAPAKTRGWVRSPRGCGCRCWPPKGSL